MMNISSLKLIKSKTRAAVLELFFNHPEAEYYLRQIEGLIGYSAGNIRRELAMLESDGLFLSRNAGNLKLYRLNKEYPLYNEIKSIIRKTIGIEAGFKAILNRTKGVDFAFIYGSFAEDNENALSDIDIIVIGSTMPKEIKSIFFESRLKIAREINSIVYTKEEFLNKIKDKNHFITAVLAKKKIFIKGDENEFRRFIQILKVGKT